MSKRTASELVDTIPLCKKKKTFWTEEKYGVIWYKGAGAQDAALDVAYKHSHKWCVVLEEINTKYADQIALFAANKRSKKPSESYYAYGSFLDHSAFIAFEKLVPKDQRHFYELINCIPGMTTCLCVAHTLTPK
jgi:hypothetical protein